MEVPIFFAKLAAVLYLCVGFGALFNKKHLHKVIENFQKNEGLDYLGAIFALILGFLVVATYNVWVWNSTVLVTIFGWGAVLKGAVHLLFPDFSRKMMERLLKSKYFGFIGLDAVIIGFIFALVGFKMI